MEMNMKNIKNERHPKTKKYLEKVVDYALSNF